LSVKSLAGLLAGTTLSPPFRPVSRLIAASTLAYLLSIGVLCVRFVSHHPRVVERFALVLVVVATCAEIVFEPSPICFLLGLCPIAATRAVGAFLPASRGRQS
jgi:hypothetical protein